MKFYHFLIIMAAIYVAPHLPVTLAAVGGGLFLVAGLAAFWIETRSKT
jgi:hypothetical protein